MVGRKKYIVVVEVLLDKSNPEAIFSSNFISPRAEVTELVSSKNNGLLIVNTIPFAAPLMHPNAFSPALSMLRASYIISLPPS